MAHQIIHPPGWAPARGYSNGVAAQGRQLYIGGQIGWNADQVFEHDDFIGQMEQALRNIVTVLTTADGHISDITRLTWYIVDKEQYLSNQREIGEAYRSVLGHHYPAMTMVVVAGLIEDAALLEIEATAVI